MASFIGFPTLFDPNKTYTFHISRLGTIFKLEIMMGTKPRVLKEIMVVDKEKAEAVFK